MRKVQYSFNGNEWTDNSGFESHVFLDLPAAYAAILQVVELAFIDQSQIYQEKSMKHSRKMASEEGKGGRRRTDEREHILS